jgi:hypothetical protein
MGYTLNVPFEIPGKKAAREKEGDELKQRLSANDRQILDGDAIGECLDPKDPKAKDEWEQFGRRFEKLVQPDEQQIKDIEARMKRAVVGTPEWSKLDAQPTGNHGRDGPTSGDA